MTTPSDVGEEARVANGQALPHPVEATKLPSRYEPSPVFKPSRRSARASGHKKMRTHRPSALSALADRTRARITAAPQLVAPLFWGQQSREGAHMAASQTVKVSHESVYT